MTSRERDLCRVTQVKLHQTPDNTTHFSLSLCYLRQTTSNDVSNCESLVLNQQYYVLCFPSFVFRLCAYKCLPCRLECNIAKSVEKGALHPNSLLHRKSVRNGYPSELYDYCECSSAKHSHKATQRISQGATVLRNLH